MSPAAIKAAWVEARRWWPQKVVEVQAGQKVAQAHYFRVVETCILVDDPAPGFREAIEAALSVLATPTSSEKPNDVRCNP